MLHKGHSLDILIRLFIRNKYLRHQKEIMDMNYNLKKISDSILSYFEDCNPGQGLFLLRTINAGNFPITYYSVINILLFNEFIYSDDGNFFRLGQNGFDYLQGDESLTLSAPPFSQLLYLEQIKDEGADFIFNELWKLIGKTDEALFYVDGPTYYNTIKPYIKGAYPTYSDFIEHLAKNNGSTSRIKWYRTLFLQLQDENFGHFLDQLSDAINQGKNQSVIDASPIQSNTFQEVSNVALNSNIENTSFAGGITVFISYSWDEHKKIVRTIATRLQEAGIKVLIDEEVPYGTDLVNYMNKEIKKCSKCLVFLTPNYKEKSESTKGGVAYEGSIISKEIYKNQETTKFIPVLISGDFDSCTPDFLYGRKGFDFVSNSFNEEIDRMIEALVC
jgi:SEFIR domain protein